jgi:hypothetical protein
MQENVCRPNYQGKFKLAMTVGFPVFTLMGLTASGFLYLSQRRPGGNVIKLYLFVTDNKIDKLVSCE